ncbi:cation transporter [Crenobacter cavernae]|uniref:cation transporter n=1 Tax=Crenobacter cavernae TaxID=2290923 RepID=UPI002482C7ED|nr:cation transporter [Crenobacter cavernae]
MPWHWACPYWPRWQPDGSRATTGFHSGHGRSKSWGVTSAIFLVLIAGLMLYESVDRIIHPSPIHYDQAIVIAFVGLLVNVACAWLLGWPRPLP